MRFLRELFSSYTVGTVGTYRTVLFLTVLRSWNYLFSAPTLTIISAPAPALAPGSAIYWHLKLFKNTTGSTKLIEVEITFSSS